MLVGFSIPLACSQTDVQRHMELVGGAHRRARCVQTSRRLTTVLMAVRMRTATADPEDQLPECSCGTLLLRPPAAQHLVSLSRVAARTRTWRPTCDRQRAPLSGRSPKSTTGGRTWDRYGREHSACTKPYRGDAA